MDLSLKNDRYDYYNICRKLLLLSGLWPYQELRERMFYMGLIITWELTIIVVQTANYFVCETMECILQTVPLNALVYIVMFKVLTYHFKIRKIKVLIEHLNADWDILCCKEEFDIMKKYAQIGRRYTLIYTTYMYIGSIMFVSSAFLPHIMDFVFPLDGNKTHPLTLPCPAYYFVDEIEYFNYIYLHIQLGALVCLTGLLAHDCNFFTFVQHSCGLFAIAGFRFERLLYKRNIMKKCLINTSDDMYIKNVVISVQAHRRALQFINRLENAFSTSFALQILMVVIGMTTSLIQISADVKGDKAKVLRHILYIIGQLLHLLFLSFLGQKLINHSLDVHAKIFNGSWYEIPVKSQRMLLFAMRKSIVTSSLTAGKIYIFCLESFTSVMQCSVSYFTVLSSFNEP